MLVRLRLKAAWSRLIAVVVASVLGVSLMAVPSAPVQARPASGGAASAAPVGELPQQEAGTAEGLSHSVPMEATAAEPDGGPRAEAAASEPLPDAPPADAVGPDVRHEPVQLARPNPEPAIVSVGAPDARSAAPVGLVTGRSVEDVDKRSSRSQVFDNPDGTKTLRLYEGPAFHQEADGHWARVRPAVVATERGWRSDSTGTEVRLAKTADAAELAVVHLDRNTSVGFRAAGVARVPGVAGVAKALGTTAAQPADAVTYTGVRQDSDLELQVLPSGVKETIVLRSAAAPMVWDFPLSLQGLDVAVVDGGVRLTDANGTLRAVIPPGYMEDAAIDPRSGSGATSYGVRYELVGNTLQVSLDAAWIADPARVFPIRVDPSVFQVGTNGTTFVQHPYTNDYSGQVNMSVGTFNGGTDVAAAYLKFDSAHAHLAGNYVLGAKLKMFETWSYSCHDRPVWVYPVTQPWSVAGNKSWPGPAHGGEAGWASFAEGHSSGCPGGPKWQEIPFNAHGTSVVHGWTHGAANHGLTVRASSSDNYGWKKFASRNSANAPYLEITYTPYWATYQIGAMTTPLTSSSNGVMQVTVTNHGRDTWTPTNTYQLWYRVWDAAGNLLPFMGPSSQVVGTAMPHTVVPGQSVLVNATVRKLPPGSYTLRWDMADVGHQWFHEQGAPMSQAVHFTVPNQTPVVDSMAPASGYAADTLTPTLRITGHDQGTAPSLVDSWDRWFKPRLRGC